MDIIKNLMDMITAIVSLATSIIAYITIRNTRGK